jgi:hypothetical protein
VSASVVRDVGGKGAKVVVVADEHERKLPIPAGRVEEDTDTSQTYL